MLLETRELNADWATDKMDCTTRTPPGIWRCSITWASRRMRQRKAIALAPHRAHLDQVMSAVEGSAVIELFYRPTVRDVLALVDEPRLEAALFRPSTQAWAPSSKDRDKGGL